MNAEQEEREAYLKAVGIDKTNGHPTMTGEGGPMVLVRHSKEILEECERREYTVDDVEALLRILTDMVLRNTDIIRRDVLFKADVQPRRKDRMTVTTDDLL